MSADTSRRDVKENIQAAETEKRDQNYAWVVFTACTLLVFVFIGACQNSKSLHMAPLTEAIGITRVTYSYILFAGSLIAALCSFFLGKIHQKLSLRTMMIIGTACAAVGNLALSVMQSVIGVIIGEILIGVANGISAMAVISLVIRNWFANRNGTVLGALYMATGLGSVVFSPIIGRLIEKGYQNSYRFQAIMMAVIFVIVVLFVREKPQDMGKVPFLFKSSGKQVKEPDRSVGLMLAEARKNPRFYLVLLIGFFMGIGTNALQGTYGAHIGTDLGYGTVFAAGIMTTIYILNSIAKIPLGMIIDKWSCRVSMMICSAAMALAAVWMFSLTPATPILAYLFGICHGIGNVSFTVVAPHVPRAVYGEKDAAAITGVYMGVNTFGSAIAMPIANIVAQNTGSYRPVYFAMIITFILATVFAFLFVRPAYKTMAE